MDNSSSYSRGDSFEIKSYHILKTLLENDDFYVSGKKSKIFRKKGYYSEKRKSKIIFDISIETYLNNSSDYSLLTLIECKNYQSPVPVSDLEEFDSKISQISEHNTKGIVITNHSFQSGANDFAKSNGIALAKVNSDDEFEWLVNRRSGTVSPLRKTEAISFLESKDLSDGLNLVAINNNFVLTTLSELLIQMEIIDSFIHKEKFINIPFVSKERIEAIIVKLESYDLYEGDLLDDAKICKFLQSKYPVAFDFDVDLAPGILGRIQFDPLKIQISKELRTDPSRWRFTLAHEIGHLILHSKLLIKKITEKTDDESTLSYKYFVSEMSTRRLELQANLFASNLLMPLSKLIGPVQRYFAEERIHKGFLYWDHQAVNQKLVLDFLNKMAIAHKVSVEAARIRLIELGLLVDDRYKSLRQILKDMKLI